MEKSEVSSEGGEMLKISKQRLLLNGMGNFHGGALAIFCELGSILHLFKDKNNESKDEKCEEESTMFCTSIVSHYLSAGKKELELFPTFYKLRDQNTKHQGYEEEVKYENEILEESSSMLPTDEDIFVKVELREKNKIKMQSELKFSNNFPISK